MWLNQGVDDFVAEWRHEGQIITFSWVGDVPVFLRRVYTLAFTRAGEMLLVGDETGAFWLPGGGIEGVETPGEALARELLEEAAATVEASSYLGAQRVEDPLHEPEYHGFHWCRIQLADDYAPVFEVTKRLLIPPEEFLDTLFWGRSDPKAAMLLEKALEENRRYEGEI